MLSFRDRVLLTVSGAFLIEKILETKVRCNQQLELLIELAQCKP